MGTHSPPWGIRAKRAELGGWSGGVCSAAYVTLVTSGAVWWHASAGGDTITKYQFDIIAAAVSNVLHHESEPRPQA